MTGKPGSKDLRRIQPFNPTGKTLADFCTTRTKDLFSIPDIPSNMLAEDPGNWLTSANYTADQDVVQNIEGVNDLAERGAIVAAP